MIILKAKTKISIMIFIIILIVGLYVGYEVKSASDKFKLKVDEMLTGKVILKYIVPDKITQ
ncbi:MAG TPA: hypothetical protein VIA08_03475 [Nitrososphaeraceae archaeon]